MTAILFDRLSYIDRLRRAGVTDDLARAHVEATEGVLQDSVAAPLPVCR
jgi:hypothetical protein